jgi:translation initiation factor IF-2
LARKLNVHNKDLMDLCVELNIDVKSHLSSITESDHARLLEALRKRSGRAESSSASDRAAAGVARAIRREDYIPASGVTARAPDMTKLVRPAEPVAPPADAKTAARKPVPARPVTKIETKPAPTVASPPPVPAPPATPPTPAAQQPKMRISPEVVKSIMRDRGQPLPAAAPPAPAAAPAPPPPSPVAAQAKAVERMEPAPPPASPSPKPPAVEMPGQKPKSPPAERGRRKERPREEERPQPHRAGAVAGREERQKRRGKRAEERRAERSEEELVHGLEAVTDVTPAQRIARIRRKGPIQVMPGSIKPRPTHAALVPPISVRTLSEAIGIRANDILRKLMGMNVMAVINSVLEPDVAQLVASEFGVEVSLKREADFEEQLFQPAASSHPDALKPRAPVVTFLGHVDHGKTSLLDAIRKTNIVATEAGGITQHLRAWQVRQDGRSVTFLDTPGHEAFTSMRARGAQVTDVVVLVVAADDGVMPQTEEAINHARAAEVPIVVAINKVDLPSANVQKVFQQLATHNLIPDDWDPVNGVPCVQTSAISGQGLDKLVETLAVVAELRELKADPELPAAGTCLEASLTEGRGVLATLLVQHGTLHRGDLVLCGESYGRVKAMYDDRSQSIREAGPSVPVKVSGLDAVPGAGEKFVVTEDLDKAREIAERRRNRVRTQELTERRHVTLETLFSRMTEQRHKELRLILRADVRGSIEAICKELDKFEHPEVTIRRLHTAVGAITESDVLLADASDAVVIGFNVVPDQRARLLAEEKGVEIRRYDIIYELANDLRKALEGLLKPELRQVETGRALVQDTFKISRAGTVAGCRVLQGVVERSSKVRLIRDGRVIYPDPGSSKEVGIASLKRFKDDVREVREGFECGIKIAGYDDLKVGDVIEAYRTDELQRTL